MEAQSDVISVSESSTKESVRTKKKNREKEGGDDKELAMSKKKLKVLKQALTDMKDQMEKVTTELKNSQKEISRITQINEEKDKKYM